jgi:HK97 family phage major capsid protein
LDVLRKAITQLQLAYHVPTGIVLHPTDWEGIELQKNTLGDYLEVTLTDANGNPVAWRCPVVPTVAIAAGTFLVGDFQSALVRDRQLATVEISNSHSDFFARNLLAIRAEQREGLEIHRPAGFVTGSLNYAG